MPFTAHDAFEGCERGAVCQVEQGVLPYREFVEEVGGVAATACLQFRLYGGFSAFVKDAFEGAYLVPVVFTCALLDGVKNRGFFIILPIFRK